MYLEFYLIYFYLSLYIPKLVANSIILTCDSNFYFMISISSNNNMYSNECIHTKDSVFCPRYLVYFNLHLGQFLVQNTKFDTFIF